jgi:hypothetical protein
MKLWGFLLLILTLTAGAAGPDWYEQYCQSTACPPQSELEKAVPSEILALGALNAQGEAVEASIQSHVDHWADFVRWLKKEPTKKPSTDAFPARWEELEGQARALVEIHRLIGSTKRKLEICRTQCSAGRRVELEVEVENFERVQAHLVTLAPWWISEEFKKITDKSEKDYEYSPKTDELKTVFIGAMSSFFTEAFAIRGQISSIEAQIETSLKGLTSKPSILIHEMYHREGPTLDLLLKRGISSGHLELCPLAAVTKKWNKAISVGSTTLQVGLVTASLLAGPEGMLAALSARSSLPLLVRIGMSTSRVSALLPNAALTSKMIYERADLAKQCNLDLALVKLGDKSEDAWKECLENKEKASLGLLLTGISTVSSPLLPYTFKLLGNLNRALPPSNAVKISLTADGKTISFLNLADAQAVKARGLETVSDRYWQFVADVYRKRLNLTDEEIKGFLESNKLYSNRTKLVMVSKGSPVNGEIEGGVAIVHSAKSSDLLPFEKATNFLVPRDSGKVAEIVRLTSVSETNQNLMKELLKEIAHVTKQDPELKKIYIYTSKVHLRLYRQMNIPHKVVGKPIERDVIVEINVKDYQEAMLK